jgi:hypothetical protein
MAAVCARNLVGLAELSSSSSPSLAIRLIISYVAVRRASEGTRPSTREATSAAENQSSGDSSMISRTRAFRFTILAVCEAPFASGPGPDAGGPEAAVSDFGARAGSSAGACCGTEVPSGGEHGSGAALRSSWRASMAAPIRTSCASSVSRCARTYVRLRTSASCARRASITASSTSVPMPARRCWSRFVPGRTGYSCFSAAAAVSRSRTGPVTWRVDRRRPVVLAQDSRVGHDLVHVDG